MTLPGVDVAALLVLALAFVGVAVRWFRRTVPEPRVVGDGGRRYVCRDCGRRRAPRQRTCPACGSNSLRDVGAEGIEGEEVGGSP